MGIGAGPPRIIVPEEEIQEAFNNGEDFTIESNEQVNLTGDLVIPAGRVLTVKGVLDLGEGNTLTENGQLKIVGGEIVNQMSHIILNGETWTELTEDGQIDIDGNITVEKDTGVTISPKNLNSSYNYIRANTLNMHKGSILTVEEYDNSATLQFVNLLLPFLDSGRLDSGRQITFKKIFIGVENEMNMESGSKLKIDPKCVLQIAENATANIRGEIELDSTTNSTYGRQIENNGTINVIGGGSIINRTENDTFKSVIEGYGKHSILNVSGHHPDDWTESKIENVRLLNNSITVGTAPENLENIGDSSMGKIYLGKKAPDDEILTSDLGSGAMMFWRIEGSDNKLTVHSTAGVLFIPGSISVTVRHVTFPQGEESVDWFGATYPKSENPGFTIEYSTDVQSDGISKMGSVVRQDQIGDNSGIQISLK